MNIEITSKFENKLLKRKEVQFQIQQLKQATPSRKMIREKLIAQFDAQKEAAMLIEIKTHLGKGLVKGLIHIYENPEVAKKIEPKYIVERNLGKPEEKKE